MGHERWRERADDEITSRAFREARALGHSWCGVEHLLLAVLDAPSATEAAAVLTELGLTRSRAEEQLRAGWWPAESGSDGAGIVATPACGSLLGTAQGLAVAFGADRVTDQHVLLPFAYTGSSGRTLLVTLGIEPDGLVRALEERGESVPPLLPPEVPPPVPMGPRVYFPESDHPAVTRAMIERFPPGTAKWGFNVSSWKPEFHWIDAEESCDAPAVIRAAVSDPSTIEALPVEMAAGQEAAALKPD